MKLLKKSVLSQELNTQRKQQIDEGVYLATNIDTLRKSLNELEEQYQNFAQNKQIELDKQFKSLEIELKEKRLELQSLEERRIELLRPLNDEWFMLTQEKELFREKEEKLSKDILLFNENKKDIDKKNKELDKKLIQIERSKNDIEILKSKHEDNLKTSENKLKMALEQEEEVERNITSKISELTSREANLASRERELDILNNHIRSREQEIIKRTILLEDREATLEREIKRRNK